MTVQSARDRAELDNSNPDLVFWSGTVFSLQPEGGAN